MRDNLKMHNIPLSNLKRDIEYDIHRNLEYLQSIKADTSLYLSILGILATLSISILYEVFKYWIISTYLLFILWFIFSLFKSKEVEKVDIEDKIREKKNQIRLKTLFDIVLINVIPMMKAVSLLFLFNIPIMVLAYGDLIKSLDFSVVITLSSFFPILALHKVKYLPEIFSESLELIKKTDKKEIKRLRKISNWFWLTVLLLLGILFLYSLMEAFSLVIDLKYDVPRLFLVSTLVFISLGFLSEYFSYNNIKEKLTEQNVLLEEIRTRIISLDNRENVVDAETIKDLKDSYLKSKLYIPAFSHIFYFFNFHIIVYNPRLLTDELIHLQDNNRVSIEKSNDRQEPEN